jgi:hypothetical protein
MTPILPSPRGKVKTIIPLRLDRKGGKNSLNRNERTKRI